MSPDQEQILKNISIMYDCVFRLAMSLGQDIDSAMKLPTYMRGLMLQRLNDEAQRQKHVTK